VIKTMQMGIPILISRSGLTVWGVELAPQAGLTLIGRTKGRHFPALAGAERIVFASAERIVFDGDPRAVEDGPPRPRRKSSLADEDAA
jgi:FdhD protein